MHSKEHVVVVAVVVIIIMRAFKGAGRDFFTTSSLHRELSPTRTRKWPRRNRVQITRNTSSAYHAQRVVCHLVRRDSSAIKSDRAAITFIFSVILLAGTINELQKMLVETLLVARAKKYRQCCHAAHVQMYRLQCHVNTSARVKKQTLQCHMYHVLKSTDWTVTCCTHENVQGAASHH